MKYALLIAFTYHKSVNGDSKISRIMGTCKDLQRMSIFCKSKKIKPDNITILTDLIELPKECNDCNIKQESYPESKFICRELAQFVENTIRGIEDKAYKSENELPEIIIYITGHGSRIKVTIPEIRDEQALVLLDNGGTEVKYLTSKDIFNILFGRLPILPTGIIEIPIYTKSIELVPIFKGMATKYKEEITSNVDLVSVQLSAVTNFSPSNSPGLNEIRSSYLLNRGIPPWTRCLFIIDTCFSAHMTHFPFIYNNKDYMLNSYNLENTFVNHCDMPYCICISACDVDKVTKGGHEGSPLTAIIYSNFKDLNSSLNLHQFYHYINDTKNSTFISYFNNKTITPVISSTINNPDINVPFFSNETIRVPKRVIK